MKTVWSALVAKAERAVREAQLRLADVNRQRENALMQVKKLMRYWATTTSSFMPFNSATTTLLK